MTPHGVEVLPSLVWYFPSWRRSLDRPTDCLADRVPWICFAAIRYLKGILSPSMRVWEFGSGGSTLFFANRVSEVVSVEHNPEWYHRVARAIGTASGTCHIRLEEPEVDTTAAANDVGDPEGYVADDVNYRGMTFRRYAGSIDGYPEGHFDMVFIDGRARPSCCKHAIEKVSEGGYLVLDNSERPHYAYVHETMKARGWRKVSFYGPVPHLLHFSETCFWQKASVPRQG